MGRVFALRLVREGAKVTVCDILDCAPVANEIKSVNGEVLALKTDVSSEIETAEMAQKTIGRFGRIDILVNNAAVVSTAVTVKGSKRLLEEITGDEWDRILEVNVKGLFLCCKAVIPHMKKQLSGKIINIGSTGAFTGIPGQLHYGASKGSVITMTKGLAAALGDFNINVNAIAPGLVMTEMAQTKLSEEHIQKILKTQLIKRSIQPEDIAAAVVFLASDEAEMITGQTLAVNAGEYLH